MRRLAVLRDEFKATVADPGRVRRATGAARLRHFWHRVRHGESDLVGGRRHYRTYEHYVAHQRLKLDLIDLSEYSRTFRVALRDRLACLDLPWPGLPVLCLAARDGSEVEAFHDLGAFAVGIDLNPGPDNRRVLVGDFHEVTFPDHSVGAVYCNSLDHALHLEQVVAEVHRLLRPGGHVVIEAMQGTDEREGLPANTAGFGRWEVRTWARAADVAQSFTDAGFELVASSAFGHPWPGRQFVLRRD